MLWLVGGSCLFVGVLGGFFLAALFATSKRADEGIEYMK